MLCGHRAVKFIKTIVASDSKWSSNLSFSAKEKSLENAEKSSAFKAFSYIFILAKNPFYTPFDRIFDHVLRSKCGQNFIVFLCFFLSRYTA